MVNVGSWLLISNFDEFDSFPPNKSINLDSHHPPKQSPVKLRTITYYYALLRTKTCFLRMSKLPGFEEPKPHPGCDQGVSFLANLPEASCQDLPWSQTTRPHNSPSKLRM